MAKVAMTDLNLYKLHAGICNILSNPKRLEIIDTLRTREMSVTELADALDISQSNLSQHLAMMRQRGILTTRRKGLNVFYSLSNPKITQACDLMRQVLLEYLEAGAELARGESKRRQHLDRKQDIRIPVNHQRWPLWQRASIQHPPSGHEPGKAGSNACPRLSDGRWGTVCG